MLTILIMVAWKFAPQRLKIVPAPLLAVVVATGVAAFFSLPIYYVSVSGNFLSDIAGPSLKTWSSSWNLSILVGGVAIALIASAETLRCATAVDQMHQGPRTNYDRELFAQGVGNTLCGLLGSIPMTGVIVRSSANIEAGGRTRGSAIFHGIWLLAAVSLLPWLLNLIPPPAWQPFWCSLASSWSLLRRFVCCANMARARLPFTPLRLLPLSPPIILKGVYSDWLCHSAH
jgi:MFS superfamily sulfate permease-like transporter